MSRDSLQHAKTIVIKVGTAVETRTSGRLALLRLGALVEAIHALRSTGRRGLSGSGVDRARRQLSGARSTRSSSRLPRRRRLDRAC